MVTEETLRQDALQKHRKMQEEIRALKLAFEKSAISDR